MQTYWILWTFIANFSESVREVQAASLVEAIEKSTLYDPRRAKGRNRMVFHVFNKEEGHVFSGTILEAEAKLKKEQKDDEILDQVPL
jgi:hypothetical protein